MSSTIIDLMRKRKETHILDTIIKKPTTVADLKDFVLQSLDDDKAMDIDVISLNEPHSMHDGSLADYIIVASGTSSTQTIRMAEKLKDRLSARGIKDIRIEGATQGDWVVIDLFDIVVHLFRPEVREFYNIEKMWKIPSLTPQNDSFHSA